MKKILLIENNPELTENLKLLLEANHYKVLTTDNNNEITDPAFSNSPPVDLIIYDTEFPDPDGFQLNKMVKLNIATQITPFIFLSAQPDLNNIIKALDKTANSYIQKPFHIKDLLNQIYYLIGNNNDLRNSVLIISSDPLTSTSVNSFLIKNNYNTFLTETCRESFEIINREKIDFIICELSFDNTNINNFLDLLKAVNRTKEIPFFIIGCGDNGNDFRNAMDIGAVNYFPKPVDLFSLLTSIEFKFSEQYSYRQKNSRNEEVDTFNFYKNIRKKILLIEDSNSLIELLSIQLKQYGLDVISALDGQSGIEFAIKEKPDLIICDVLLPEMNGYNVLSILKNEKTTCGIPFFFLTGKSDFSDIKKGMNQGADDYFIKPVEIAELVKAINKKLGTDYSLNSTKKYNRIIKDNIADNDFIPLSSRNKEILNWGKNIEISQIKKSESETKTQVDSVLFENKEQSAFSNDKLKLDLFLNTKSSFEDYESLFYHGVEIVKVNISNAMDADTQKFYRYLFEKIDDKKHVFLIDLRSIEFITSSFIGVIISAQRKLNFVSGYICLVINPKTNNNLMIFQNLSRVIEIYEDFNIAVDEMIN